MLTKKQKELLLFIYEHMKDGDIPPSFDEMKDALGLKSKSGIHRLVTALVDRGYLERLPHKARAIEVKRLPAGYQASLDNDRDNAAQSNFVRNACVIPFYGKIAAGTPAEAIKDKGQLIEVPSYFLEDNNDCFALKVEGNSMIKAGINNKDTVIIQKCNSAQEGQIVVALVDKHEATLKRFYSSNNKIILKPENDEFDDQVYDSSRIEIQGKLVGLIRNY